MILEEADPQGADALALLRQAAVEARALYPELATPEAPWPVNVPTPARGTYLVGTVRGVPVACGALRPLDAEAVEVRRMYVRKDARRRGLAREVLRCLEQRARALAFTVMRLETGHRQEAAMALYASCGFRRIPPFGDHVDDPTSVCYEKRLA